MVAVRRRGTSLVEVIMALGIIGAALVPIGWYFVSSARQQANLKAEAVAAAYAGKIMNMLLDELPFDDVVTGVGIGDVGSADEVDGTKLEWIIEVGDTAPADISFNWTPITDDGMTPPMTANFLDAKFRDLPAIKDIMLTIQWQSPRDTEMGGPTRTQVLVTRRARLARREAPTP